MSLTEKKDEEAALDEALSTMILSASGWRTVFAADGNEENPAPGISAEHKLIASVAAKVFADYVKGATAANDPVVVVGMDARPTGSAIADVFIRVLLGEDVRVQWAGITAAPEIMAYMKTAGTQGRVHGFAYISASHNPIGHNGLKFGLTDGGVLPGQETKLLIDAFKAFFAAPDRIEKARRLADHSVDPAVYASEAQVKREALAAYRAFTREVIADASDEAEQDRLFDAMSKGIKQNPTGIVADFNGSARAVSIDKEFLPALGVNFAFINGEAGKIAHRIVPEGESLSICAAFLSEKHAADSSFVMGYMPDCDGDRGNIVIWDDSTGAARPLEAQEVFALACVAELSHLVWGGKVRLDETGRFAEKVAIAVNDPTSLRIDAIVKAFGAEVFRAEVGEANVVSLARKLRGQGYTVRILGEGSAGGNITHPSAVRDPIDTVGALIKMLTIRGGKTGGGKGLFEIWRELSGNATPYKENFTLSDVISTLPRFFSTGSYTTDALLKVKTADHAILKERYQTIFLREWEGKKASLTQKYGIVDWEAAAYNGIEEKLNIQNFGEAGRGGLKITFMDAHKACIAAIWMRGSGTEPVFRVMADALSLEAERELIAWQRDMVSKADSV